MSIWGGHIDEGGVNMPKWAKTPPMVNRILSALSCRRVHQQEIAPRRTSEEEVFVFELI